MVNRVDSNFQFSFPSDGNQSKSWQIQQVEMEATSLEALLRAMLAVEQPGPHLEALEKELAPILQEVTHQNASTNPQQIAQQLNSYIQKWNDTYPSNFQISNFNFTSSVSDAMQQNASLLHLFVYILVDENAISQSKGNSLIGRIEAAVFALSIHESKSKEDYESAINAVNNELSSKYMPWPSFSIP